ncbi:MAG: DUF4065 domain-containing protein [Olegusella sp.]|nr:DUF4065 domain-containing protein [Olegusella sp.]
MCTVVDVAAYILDHYGPMTTMKLQKLTYYSQAHCLSSQGKQLFGEDFQAWVNGPVCPELYREHRGKFMLHRGDLDGAVDGHEQLTDYVKREIDAVCDELSELSGNELSRRTHGETPWQQARRGYSPSAHCEVVITKSSMRSYYSLHPVI